MMCWVTETSENSNKYIRPTSYKFHSSMMGGLGVGADISKFDDNEIIEYKYFIEIYKQIRETIQLGKQYRLRSPIKSSISSVQYINSDDETAVVFAFLNGQIFGNENPLLRLNGLCKTSVYEVTYIANKSSEKHNQKTFTCNGSTLMHVGIPLYLFGDFDSTMVRLKKQIN